MDKQPQSCSPRFKLPLAPGSQYGPIPFRFPKHLESGRSTVASRSGTRTPSANPRPFAFNFGQQGTSSDDRVSASQEKSSPVFPDISALLLPHTGNTNLLPSPSNALKHDGTPSSPSPDSPSTSPALEDSDRSGTLPFEYSSQPKSALRRINTSPLFRRQVSPVAHHADGLSMNSTGVLRAGEPKMTQQENARVRVPSRLAAHVPPGDRQTSSFAIGDMNPMFAAAMQHISQLEKKLKEELAQNAEQSKSLASLQHLPNQVVELTSSIRTKDAELQVLRSELQASQTDAAQLRERFGREQTKLEQESKVISEGFQSRYDAIKIELENAQLASHHTLRTFEEEKDTLSKENSSLRGVVHSSQRQLAGLKERVSDLLSAHEHLKSDFANLGKGQEASLTPALLKEVHEIRSWVTETLGKLSSVIDLETGGMPLMAEMKETIIALKQNIDDSYRVNDILRDKLQHISSQLVDARTQIHELEEEKREMWSGWNASLQEAKTEAATIQSRWNSIPADFFGAIAKSEQKLVDALMEAANLETKLLQAGKELRDVKVHNESLRSEVESLRALKQETQNLRERIQACENEILQRNTEVEVLRNTDKNMQQRLGEREAELSRSQKLAEKLQGSVRVAEESTKKLEIQCSVLEERLNSQTITLRLTKECSGDLQERVIHLEKAHVRDLESHTGQLAVLQHQRAQLEEEVQRLKEEINKQYETIQLAAREAENRLTEERRTREQLIQSEKAHVESLTKGLSECKLSTKQLQSQKEEHVTRIQSLQQQVSSAENEGNIHKCVVDDLRAQLVEAKRLISVGEERSRTFENRYRLGQLSPDEKLLIQTLGEQSRAVYERELVEKNNEIRRLEQLSLKAEGRVKSLETSIARFLKERGRDVVPPSNSIVDVEMWVHPASSPVLAAERSRNGQFGGNSTLVTPSRIDGNGKKEFSSSQILCLDNRQVVMAPGSISFAQLGHTDSEDDTPLSELSHLTSSLGKHPRESSPARPEVIQTSLNRPLKAPTSRKKDASVPKKAKRPKKTG